MKIVNSRHHFRSSYCEGKYEDVESFFWVGGLLQLECKHFAQKIARYEMIKRTEIIMHFSLKKKSRYVTLVLKREERTCGFVVILSQAFLLWAGR